MKNFVRLLLDFSAPLSSVVLMMFGSAFFTTFLSVYLDTNGYSQEQIGVIHSAYFLGLLIGAFKMEKLITRVGHIQSLAVFSSLATSVTLLQALYPNFYAWVFLRFLCGLSLAAIYIVIESWLLYHSTLKTRGVLLSLYMISLTGAQAISQQVMSFIEINSFTPFLLSALFTSLSVIPVSLSINRIKLQEITDPIKYRMIIRKSPLGVVGCFVSGLILSAIYSFFPIFAISKGIASANLMSVTIAGGLLLQWPIGKLSDFFDRRKTLVACVWIAILLNIFMFVFPKTSTETTLILMFCIGGFLISIYPLSIAQVCDHLDSEHFTRATAFLLVVYGIGSVTGPLLASFFVSKFGIQSLFLLFTTLLLSMGVLGLYRALSSPDIPMDEQSDFIPVPNLTPVALEMDPRGE